MRKEDTFALRGKQKLKQYIKNQKSMQVELDAKQRYQSVVESFQEKSATLLNEINELNKEKKKFSLHSQKYCEVILAWNYLALLDVELEKNNSHVMILGRYNSTCLTNARKHCYTALSCLSKVYGESQDMRSISEQKEFFDGVNKINPRRILNFSGKFSESFEWLDLAHKDESKYRWSLLDLQARWAWIYKNMLNYSVLFQEDPENPYYVENVDLMVYLEELFQKLSQLFRQKYLVDTKRAEDMERCIAFLDFLRWYYVQRSNMDESMSYKRMIETCREILKKEERWKKQREQKNKSVRSEE